MEAKYDIFLSPTKSMPSHASSFVLASALQRSQAIGALRSSTGISTERAQAVVDNGDIANTSGGWIFASSSLELEGESSNEEGTGL